MGFADLHIHSTYSYDGTSTIPAILKYVADETDLDVIAITDHNSIAGVQEAMAMAPRYGIEVIPGCEISTADGHLLGLFIHEPVPARLSLVETVLAVAEQGGLCVAAHPTARGTSSLQFETIEAALRVDGVAECLVGIEAFNGGLVYTRSNRDVAERARNMPLARVGNSDAHVLSMIGHGATNFWGHTAQDLRRALVYRQTSARAGKGLGGIEVLRSYIPRYLLRKLGWAAWNAHPLAPLKTVRLARVMTKNSMMGSFQA